MINKFIVFLIYNKVNKYKKVKNINISSKYFQNIKVDDVIYLAETKNNNHIMSGYGYCFNCAYKTWDVGKSIGKYCAPLIYKKFKVIKTISRSEEAKLVIQLVDKFFNPKLLLDFQYCFLNKKVLKIDD